MRQIWLIVALIQIVNSRLQEDMGNWLKAVSDPKVDCPLTKEEIVGLDLIKIVQCNTKDALFAYSYKAKDGIEKSGNDAFNGPSILTFPASKNAHDAKLNHGLKTGKCLNIGLDSVLKISGAFHNDSLEGLFKVHFKDGGYAVGKAKNGKLSGILRRFSQNSSTIQEMVDGSGHLLMKIEGDSLYLACQQEQIGPRCVVTSMKFNAFQSCIIGDKNFKANCRDMQEMPKFTMNGCELSVESAECQIAPTLNNLETLPCIPSNDSKKGLEEWMLSCQNPDLLANQFTSLEPFDMKNPVLNLTFSQLDGRPDFGHRKLYIESISGDLLFRGDMINGSIFAKIDPLSAQDPRWRTRITIAISTFKFQPEGKNESGQLLAPLKRYKGGIVIFGTLKNGSLHGLVQIFGIVTNHRFDHCSSSVNTEGLAFIGKYERGLPHGICWRGLTGGSWIYGQVDGHGEFTGKNVAYIYPDFQLAKTGQFTKGVMIYGREANILKAQCNPDGIMTLEFGQTEKSQIYHYDQPTEQSYGDQPLMQDPLDNKYILVKESQEPNSGQGVFAKVDIPKNTVFTVYSGKLFQGNELHQKIMEMMGAKGHEDISTWAYVGHLTYCDIFIYLSHEDGSMMSKYKATLGHKINHKFAPNAQFIELDSPRFGLIWAGLALQDIRAGEELFASYGYQVKYAPAWYVNSFEKFAQDFPDLVSKNDIQNLNFALERIRKSENTKERA